MAQAWKRIVLPEATFNALKEIWKNDEEAQRRGQKFNPWVNMYLMELIVDSHIKREKVKSQIPVFS